MLPPFIIEQIKRREEEERQNEQPQLEIPKVDPTRLEPAADEAEENRGVVVIDLM